MSDLLLIHGSCHGAWCWDATIAALRSLGHEARAIDMPGRGADPRPMETVTLSDFAGAILAAARGFDRPPVLVGHSAGGFSIAAAAEAAPDLFAGLIFLCAYVPRPGLSVADLRRAGPRQPLAGRIRTAPDRRTFAFAPGTGEELFFHDCSDPVTAANRLIPEAVAPQETALPFTARSEALPRHYVRCTGDRVIPPEYQSVMASPFGAHVTDLATGHSPFLAAPRALARLLAGLAS